MKALAHAAFVAALGMSGAAFAQGQPSADELVAKNLAARGGAEALAALKSVKFTGKLIFPGDFELTYDETRAHEAKGDATRIDAALQGLTLVQAYDALPEGGAYIVIENIIDDARRENAFGLLMSLNMLIEFGDAFDFTGADFAAWCDEAGFREVGVVPLAGPASGTIFIEHGPLDDDPLDLSLALDGNGPGEEVEHQPSRLGHVRRSRREFTKNGDRLAMPGLEAIVGLDRWEVGRVDDGGRFLQVTELPKLLRSHRDLVGPSPPKDRDRRDR